VDKPAATGLEAFVERPLTVAAALAKGDCGGTYIEAAMLVASAISAVASFVWPGKGQDQKRFVQAWVNFGGPESVRVSLPFLRHRLRQQGRSTEATSVERLRPTMFGPGNRVRVVTGDDVDVEEDTLRRVCPSLELPLLRELSYPSLFYEHVRSAAVHEYGLGEPVSGYPVTFRRDVAVSYTNELGMMGYGPAGDYVLYPAKHPRRIYFHVAWLLEHARTIARGADNARAAGPVPKPSPWWTPKRRRERS
jgi:hypothetical protein